MKRSKAHFIIVILAISTLIISQSCEKKDPELPLSTQIEGNYTVNYYTSGSTRIDLPATINGVTASAKVLVSTVLDNSANFVFVFTQSTNGIDKSSTSTISNLELSKNSNGEIIGQDSKSNSISFKNNQLVVTFYDSDPDDLLVIHAQKDN